MKLLSFILALGFVGNSYLVAQVRDTLSVTVREPSGAVVKDPEVAVILDSGAFQKGELEAGVYKCPLQDKPAKIIVAAPGHEAATQKIDRTKTSVTIILKPNPIKSSVIIGGRGPLPGIEGDISPIIDNQKRTYLYSTGIGLLASGHPAQQPLHFSLNRPIDAQTPDGRKFKIVIVDIAQKVSLVEYSLPK